MREGLLDEQDDVVGLGHGAVLGVRCLPAVVDAQDPSEVVAHRLLELLVAARLGVAVGRASA